MKVRIAQTTAATTKTTKWGERKWMGEQMRLWKTESNNNSLRWLIFKITFSIFISPQVDDFYLGLSVVAAVDTTAACLVHYETTVYCAIVLTYPCFWQRLFRCVLDFFWFELHPWCLWVTAVNDAATATAILKNNTTNKCMRLRKSNQKARDKGLSITM